jgi:hypothetical protein
VLYTLEHMVGDSIDLLHSLSQSESDERAFAGIVIIALAERTWQEPERAVRNWARDMEALSEG